MQTGVKLPSINFQTRVRDESIGGPNPFRWEMKTTADYFAGKRVVLFSLPGAFTPTCSTYQLPGFENGFADFHAQGIDEIYCMSVNDAFVMQAWGESAGAEGKVTMLADGNGDFARALGLTMDGSKFGLGERGSRWSAIVNDGVVEQLNVEEPGAFSVSSADYLIERL